MKKTTTHPLRSVHDAAHPAQLLHAAEADAERRFGGGPVPAWHPSIAWGAWVAGAAAVVAAAGALAVFWPTGDGPVVIAAAAPLAPAEPSAGATARHEPAPHAAPQPSTPAAEAAPAGAAMPAGDEREPAPCAAECPSAPVQTLPHDLDAWALDPDVVAPPVVAVIAARLVNTPPLPDESDATPGDETLADAEPAPAGD